MDPARDVKSTRQLYLGGGFHEGLSLEQGAAPKPSNLTSPQTEDEASALGASPVRAGVP
jgi:hypothetical protein